MGFPFHDEHPLALSQNSGERQWPWGPPDVLYDKDNQINLGFRVSLMTSIGTYSPHSEIADATFMFTRW